jgi:hypothetical protein
MADLSTGQIFTLGQQNINAPQMNNIIGLASINSSFITTKNPITNLQNNDNFILARNDGSWARITGAALADGLVNAEPNFSRIAVGPLQAACPLICGDMSVWQRNTSFAALGAAAHTKLNDKWASDAVGAMTGRCTVSRQLAGITGTSFYPDTEYCSRITITTSQASLAAGDAFSVGQYVEQQLARVLYDNPASLSLLLRCSITGTFCVSLRNNNAGTPNQSYVVDCPITSANVWQRFPFPAISTMPTGTGTWGTSDTDYSYILSVCAGSGATFQTSAATWNTGNFLADSNQTNLFATNGATLDIALVQHELGSIVTPFVWTPWDSSLTRCQRYYYKSYDYSVYPGAVALNGAWSAYTTSTSVGYVFQRFPVIQRADMLTSVSQIFGTTTGSSGKVFNNGTAAEVALSGPLGNNSQWGPLLLSSATLFTAANVLYFQIVSDNDY